MICCWWVVIVMGGDETLNTPMTIVAMVNGMIGGLILILPILALDAGYMLTFLVILVTGFFSWYSCYLCVKHCDAYPDLDEAILRHFNGNRILRIFYDMLVWCNLTLLAMLYLSLIVIQWEGLVPPHDYNIINPIVNAVVLYILAFVLKYFEFGATIMALGIVSIIFYLMFLVWVIVTRDDGSGHHTYVAFGSGAVNLAAAMGLAFSIQSFFIPIIKKNPNTHRHVLYVVIAYILGSSAYYYIGYLGSLGIQHRVYRS